MKGRSPEIKYKIDNLKEKTAYLKLKSEVSALEKQNRTRIYVLHSDGEWWKIIGRSVLYYKYLFAPRVRRTVNVREDTDYDYVSKYGVINIRDLNGLKADVKKAGFEVSKDSTESLYIILLHNKIDDATLSKLKQTEQADWDTMQNMLIPTVVWPELASNVRKLQREVRNIFKNLPTELKMTFGNGLIAEVTELNRELVRGLHSLITPMECLERMDEVNYGILADLSTMVNLQCTTPQKVNEASTACIDVKRLIRIERKKEIKKDEGTSRAPKRRSVITGEDDELIPIYNESTRKTPRQISEESKDAKKAAQRSLWG